MCVCVCVCARACVCVCVSNFIILLLHFIKKNKIKIYTDMQFNIKTSLKLDRGEGQSVKDYHFSSPFLCTMPSLMHTE